MLIHLHLTHRLLDQFGPAYMRPELYDYPYSYWAHPRWFDALNEPVWVYSFHSLIGHHGLFSMTPLFLLSIPGFWVMWRRRGNSLDERCVSLLLAWVTVMTVVIYIRFGPSNYGGKATGMRWFIVLTPLLWYAAVRYVDEHFKRWVVRWGFRFFVLVGIIHATLALSMPFRVSPWNHLFRQMGLGSLPPAEW